MKRLALLPILTLALMAVTSAPGAEDSDYQTVPVPVPKGDKLALRIPIEWHGAVVQPTPETPPTVKLETEEQSLSFQFTFLPDPEGRFATREGVDRAVSEANEHYVDGSVERRLTLTQIPARRGHGCYCAFTDADLADVAKPEKGQFKYVVSGIFVIGKQAAVFTLLCNDRKNEDYKQALQILTDGIVIQ